MLKITSGKKDCLQKWQNLGWVAQARKNGEHKLQKSGTNSKAQAAW